MLSFRSRRATGAVLLASLALAAFAASCCQGKEKTQEELEFEAARKAYKELFVSSSSLTPQKALRRLATMTKWYGRADLNMPIDYHLLLSFNQTEEGKCDSYEYVVKLKDVYDNVERNYKALRKYMHDCLDRQLKLCNFEQRFREKFENFKHGSPGEWKVIQEFNRQADYSSKRSTDWQSGALDNTPQMNEALERMARKIAKPGEDGYKSSYQLAVDLRSACAKFDDRLAAGLLMTQIAGKNLKNKEIKEWNRLMSVCRQVGRVNLEPALGRIMAETYMPEFQQAWDWYENFRQ